MATKKKIKANYKNIRWMEDEDSHYWKGTYIDDDTRAILFGIGDESELDSFEDYYLEDKAYLSEDGNFYCSSVQDAIDYFNNKDGDISNVGDIYPFETMKDKIKVDEIRQYQADLAEWNTKGDYETVESEDNDEDEDEPDAIEEDEKDDEETPQVENTPTVNTKVTVTTKHKDDDFWDNLAGSSEPKIDF